MYNKNILSLHEAERILNTAQMEAESKGLSVVIAIVDDGGHLIALRRLDGAAPMGINVATHKARTAALGRKATRTFEEMINKGRYAFLSVASIEATMTGGLPIISNGEVIGAVGVSGATPDQDEEIGNVGISDLGL